MPDEARTCRCEAQRQVRRDIGWVTIKEIGGNSHESRCLHEIWTTRSASAPGSGKAHAQSQRNPHQDPRHHGPSRRRADSQLQRPARAVAFRAAVPGDYQTEAAHPGHGTGRGRRRGRPGRDALQGGGPGVRLHHQRGLRLLCGVQVSAGYPAGPRPETGQHPLRGSRRPARRGCHRPARAAQCQPSAGADGADLRRVGQRGDVCRPARPGRRGGRDRGVQHGQSGTGALAGSQRGHRLHSGGFYPAWGGLRRRLRCRQ